MRATSVSIQINGLFEPTNGIQCNSMAPLHSRRVQELNWPACSPDQRTPQRKRNPPPGILHQPEIGRQSSPLSLSGLLPPQTGRSLDETLPITLEFVAALNLKMSKCCPSNGEMGQLEPLVCCGCFIGTKTYLHIIGLCLC